MHIAIATDIPALGPGGLEGLVRELVIGLSKHHRLTLAAADNSDDITSSGISRHLAHYIQVSPGSSQLHDPALLASELSARDVDICHFHLTGTHGWRSGSKRLSPILKVNAAGIRCFSTNHQAISPFDLSRAGEPTWRRLASHIRKFPGKAACLKAVEHEFLVSEHDLKIARIWLPGFSGKFRRMYHSCLDAVPPPVHLPHSKQILNLATVCFRKGQHILTRAFAEVADDFPEWSLRLVGRLAQPECVDEIKQVIASNNLEKRVALSGATNDPTSAIRNCEIYAQPSLLEGLGLSLQEALFHGRACIGSKVGGIPELITHETNGLLTTPNNPQAMAEALRTMMNSRVTREEFATEASASIPAKGMTKDTMLRTHLELYQHTTKKS